MPGATRKLKEEEQISSNGEGRALVETLPDASDALEDAASLLRPLAAGLVLDDAGHAVVAAGACEF